MKSLLLGLAVVLFLCVPAVFLAPVGSEFKGADAQAEKVISALHPGYVPWFSSIWKPSSSEIESLLFALQAALGAGVLCYYLGYARGRQAGTKTGARFHATD